MKMIIVLSEEDFVKVADTKDIPHSKMKEVQVDGENICVANVEGKYYAIGSICTHEGGPLADGTLEGYEVECPWHQSKFDVRTGEVTSPPASEPEPSYEIKVDANNILIKKQGKSKSSPQIELTLLGKDKVEGTDVTSFKFSKQNDDNQKGLEDKTPFNYTAGQFAFFDIGGVYNDPKGPIRHFTISSSPTENFIMFSTRIRDSPYKKRLSTLEEGAKVKVRGPEGKFVLHQDYSKKRPAVFLSGGIGVTPFRSVLKYATDTQLPIKIIMFDSNRNRSNILFKEEFDDWADRNKNLKIIYTISEDEDPGHEQSSSAAKNDWKGEYGRINKAMIFKYVDNNILDNSIFYICGPPSMLKAMQSLLQEELEIPKERIKVEEFTGY
jgi:ferredoxin-NADP reductase/nitrite reductase/ring-hydroxylating ferredoxin subunit